MFPGFTLFGRFYGSYPIMAAIGAIVAGLLAIMLYKKKTGDGYPMLITLLISSVGVFVGGTLLYGITNVQYWHLLSEAADFEQFWGYLTAIFGGSVFYGGLFGGAAAALIVIRANRYPRAEITDCAAPAVPLFHLFGRIGCFLGGCCYGIESKFGFTFTHSVVESANGVRRFPVQLLEAGFNLLLFIFLLAMLKKEKLKGRLFLLYLGLYAPARFGLEFLRGDTYRGYIFGLSTSQLISLGIMLVLGIYAVITKLKKIR